MKKKIIPTLALLFAAISINGCTRIEYSEQTSQYIETAETTEITTVSETDKGENTEPTTTAATSEMTSISETVTEPTTSITPDTSDTVVSESAEEITYDEKAPNAIRIAFGGDITQSDVFGEYTNSHGIDYAFKDIAPITLDADIAFFNLETSVSDRGVSEKKEGFGFRTEPDKLKALIYAGIDIVSLANNHVRDFGLDALGDTFNNLDDYRIAYCGAGRNADEAEQLKIVKRGDFTVGFAAFNTIIHNDTWAATAERAGLAALSPDTEKRYLELLGEYDKQCDILVVSVHWGYEYEKLMTAEQIRLGHAFVDAGADLVLGHHPHVLQPIEMYNGAPIFYSLGNFLFYKMTDEVGKTALFTADFDENGFASAKMYPVLDSYCKAVLLESGDEKYSDIIGGLSESSAAYGIVIDKNGNITAKNSLNDPPSD